MEHENKQYSADFLNKLSTCKTVEELRSAAAAEGQELTEQEAASLLKKLQLQSKELSDDELDQVAGGGWWQSNSHSSGDTPLYSVGQKVIVCTDGVSKYYWATILAVSKDKSGLLFEEFTYKVRYEFDGTVETDIYEGQIEKGMRKGYDTAR